jgi:hypothetical protein
MRHLPPPTPPLYTPDANELRREAKRVAAGVAHTLTNYGPDIERPLWWHRSRDSDRRAAVTKAVRPLWRGGEWSRGRVVYPQLGGIAPGRVSVMVVVEQQTGKADQVEHTVTRTIDVRLMRDGDDWVLDEVASIGGTPVDRPADLQAPAAAVVDDPRIALPDSARWDIYRGMISTTLLRLMSALADRTPYAVVTLSSGHPYNVFGTDRQGNHSKGRAFDVYTFDGQNVIDDREQDSTTRRHVEWLLVGSNRGQRDIIVLGHRVATPHQSSVVGTH